MQWDQNMTSQAHKYISAFESSILIELTELEEMIWGPLWGQERRSSGLENHSLHIIIYKLLSPGQTDRQVVASGRKLNLRKLALGGQTARKFLHKYTQVAKKRHFKTDYPLCYCLIIGWWTLLNLRWLGLGGQTVKNLRLLARKFDLDQSERKSSQVNASARKAWPNEVASWPKSSTYVNLRLRLNRALEQSVTIKVFTLALHPPLMRHIGKYIARAVGLRTKSFSKVLEQGTFLLGFTTSLIVHCRSNWHVGIFKGTKY